MDRVERVERNQERDVHAVALDVAAQADDAVQPGGSREGERRPRREVRSKTKILADGDKKNNDKNADDPPGRRRSLFLAFDDHQLFEVWDMLNHGIDPTTMRRGDCGCGDSCRFMTGGER